MAAVPTTLGRLRALESFYAQGYADEVVDLTVPHGVPFCDTALAKHPTEITVWDGNPIEYYPVAFA